MLLSHALHGGGVELEVGVLGLAVGEIALLGQVLEGDGRDQDEAWRGLAVVGLGERVDHKGVELGFVIGDAARAVEGFVVAEERHDGVGLQVEEPLVGRGEEPLAVVLGVFGVELLGTGEGPLARAGRVGAKSRCIARAAHVAHEELLRREAQVEFGLELSVVGVAFRETVADEHDAFAGRRGGDGLRARDGGGRRVERRRVGRR